MHATRARIGIGSIVLVGLLAAPWAGAVAAAGCSLSAPVYVNVGSALTIEGTGFPGSADVDIALSIQGGGSDEFSVQSDAAGALLIALTPEVIDIGVTTATATAGSTCTAQVTYTVLAAGASPPPAPPEPTEQVDTENEGTGAAPAAPSTDAADRKGVGGTSSWGLVLGFVLIALGGAGLALPKSPRRR